MRGSGKTTRQLQELPVGDYCIWCTNDTWYPKNLCRQLGREDVVVLPRSALQRQNAGKHIYGREIPGFDIDHAINSVKRLSASEADGWNLWYDRVSENR